MLASSAVGLAISGFILGLPFLIYGPKYTVEDLRNTGPNSTIFANLNIGDKATMTARCGANTTIHTPSPVRSESLRHTGAFAIQMVGGIINGIAACPFWNIGICFLDDMAGKRSGGYLGEFEKSAVVAVVTLSFIVLYMYMDPVPLG